MIYKPPVYLAPLKSHKAFVTVQSFIQGSGGGKILKPDWASVNKVNEDIIIWGLKEPELFEKSDNFWYLDNGYFHRSEPRTAFNGYYRIVRNGLYGDGNHLINALHSGDKWDSYGIRLQKWRGGKGSKIVLVPPTEWVVNIINEHKWVENTKKTLSQYTDRPIEISTKEKPINWDDDIWCIVVCFSNIQVDALIRGIPVITTKYTNIGKLEDIETPPDESSREVLLGLAGKQWTIEEMKNGTAWRELNCES